MLRVSTIGKDARHGSCACLTETASHRNICFAHLALCRLSHGSASACAWFTLTIGARSTVTEYWTRSLWLVSSSDPDFVCKSKPCYLPTPAACRCGENSASGNVHAAHSQMLKTLTAGAYSSH